MQKLAERACDELAANPPSPPFTQATLRISEYASGGEGLNVSSPSMTLYQPSIHIAVESRQDFVSQGIKTSGVLIPLCCRLKHLSATSAFTSHTAEATLN
jgi:hypothetical protein